MNNLCNALTVFEKFFQSFEEMERLLNPDIGSFVYANKDRSMYVRVEFARSDSFAYDFRVQIFDKTEFEEKTK